MTLTPEQVKNLEKTFPEVAKMSDKKVKKEYRAVDEQIHGENSSFGRQDLYYYQMALVNELNKREKLKKVS